jgi:protein O-GlcNAc transferase
MNQPTQELFAAGLTHHRVGQLDDAERCYIEAIEADPANCDAMLNLAGIKISANLLDDAQALLTAARTIRPTDPNILAALANVHQARGDNAQAETYYRDAIARRPDLALAHANLGRLLYHTDRLEDAIESYLEALKIDPSLATIHANLGAALVSAGRLDDAERSLSLAMSLAPQDSDIHLNMGHVRFSREDYEGALESFTKASSLRMGWAKAHMNMGTVLHHLGKYSEAETQFNRAVILDTGDAEALRGLATTLISLKKFGDAESALLRSDAISPANPRTQFLLGQVFVTSEDFARAKTYFSAVVDRLPNLIEARLNLGRALQELNQHPEAMEHFEAAITLDANSSHAHNNLGNSLFALERYEEAIAAYHCAIDLDTSLAIAHINLGNTLRHLGRHGEAMEEFSKGLEIDPDDPRALNGLGLVLQAFNRHTEAVETFKRAIAIDDSYPEAMNNLATTYQNLGRYYESISTYNDLIKRHPDLSQAYFNLGSLLQLVNRHDEAVTAFREALNRNLGNNIVYPYLAHGLMQQCSWDNLEAIISRVLENTEKDIQKGQGMSVPPFGLQSMPANLDLRMRTAQHVAQIAEREVHDSRKRLGSLTYKDPGAGKLKIGFMSPDFRFHSVAVAFRGVLENRNPDRYHYAAYAITTYGKDDLTRHFSETFDSWTDITDMSHVDAARKIADDGVNVLVDLAGHTRGGRLELLALRPAPVQAHWLGFSSTTGASYIDYLVTDRIQLPPEDQEYCSEKLVYLPDTFMATTRPPVAVETYVRSDFGLPEEGFVFANFNSHYKFYPTLFATWMRLLRQTPRSVMWFSSGTSTSQSNLKREAEARGIDPARLIFSSTIVHPQHLARLPLADLALDNLHHGGGVTTTDALWAGVPVLTLYGPTPPARNGATLVSAIGAPELIAYSIDEYEKKARAYATQPELLAKMKSKLRQNRDEAPLFHIDRLTRHFESACDLMWQNYVEGNEPRMIDVPALPPSA